MKQKLRLRNAVVIRRTERPTQWPNRMLTRDVVIKHRRRRVRKEASEEEPT